VTLTEATLCAIEATMAAAFDLNRPDLVIYRYEHGGGRVAIEGDDVRELLADLYAVTPAGALGFFSHREREAWICARLNAAALVAEVRALRAALAAAREALDDYADTIDGERPAPNRAMSAMTAIDLALGDQ
jgi:hypothetical protein